MPVLLLWGECDERVPPAVSLERIRAALAAGGNSRLTARIFPGADHTFRIASASGQFAWPRSAEVYPDVLPSWIKRMIER